MIFTDSSYNRVYSYNLGDISYIKVTDPDRNIDPAAIDTITVTVYHYAVLPGGSRSVDDQEAVTCQETGPNTGVFVGNLPTNSGPPLTGDGILSIQPYTPIEVIYTDPLDAVPSHDDNVFVDPLGTVFDTATGLPVAGAVVTLIDDKYRPAGRLAPDAVSCGAVKPDHDRRRREVPVPVPGCRDLPPQGRARRQLHIPVQSANAEAAAGLHGWRRVSWPEFYPGGRNEPGDLRHTGGPAQDSAGDYQDGGQEHCLDRRRGALYGHCD